MTVCLLFVVWLGPMQPVYRQGRCPMVLQMREDRVDDTGAVVLRKGQRVTAKPTPRLGYYRVCADGPPYRVPVSAVEPVDDLDLPEPEPVKIEVLLRESAS